MKPKPTPEDRQAMGDRIKAARKARNLSQAELADEIGVTDMTVSRWERGISYPVAMARRALEALGVPS